MPKAPSELPNSQVKPKPELEKRTRRRFTTEYKVSIIAKADACQHGELGALLRQENLYSGQIQQWRHELEQGGVECLEKTSPGPKASKTPSERIIEQLQKENARLNRKLQIATDCVDLQKKALSMLDHANSGSDA